MKKNRTVLFSLAFFFLLVSTSSLFAQDNSVFNDNLTLLKEELDLLSIMASFFEPTLTNLFRVLTYLFSSYALFKIAKEMKSGKAWFAWIPVLDIILVCKLVEFNTKWLLLLLGFIVGFFVSAFFQLHIAIFLAFSLLALVFSLAITFSIYSKLAEKRGYPGLLILIFLIPFAGPFIYYYLLAWEPRAPIGK